MTREDYDSLLEYDMIDEAQKYVLSLEAKIAELEHEGELQWDTHQMCQIINLKRIAELEAQNKALTDMVEMQSEKIIRLEAPKSCEHLGINNTTNKCIYCGVIIMNTTNQRMTNGK